MHLAPRYGTSVKRHAVRVAVLLLSATIAWGCAKPPPPPPPPPKPNVLGINVSVAADSNPDGQSRPSPLVVRLYELKAAAQFDTLDFISLQDKDQSLLASDIVARDEWVMQPGQSMKLNRKLNPDTRVVAAMASFRDLERATWRATLPVTPLTDQTVQVLIAGRAVRLSRP